MDDALRSEDEDHPSIPAQSATAVPDSFSQFPNHPQLCTQIRELTQEEATGVYALEVDKSLLKAAKAALSNAFRIDFESTNDGLKNTPFRFVECVLANIALKGTLDDILDRNIEK